MPTTWSCSSVSCRITNEADCPDGDQLYNGVKELVAQHLDTLAEQKVVPAFPRSSGTHGAGKMGGGAEAIERALEGDMFLKALKGVWEDHTGSMHKITAVVRYMVSIQIRVCSTDGQDKVYAPSAGVPLIYDVGLSIFLQNIVRSSKYPIHTHLIATLLSQVQLERDGETITRSTVRECVDILLRLTVPEREGGKNVYLTDFEPEFLKRSAEFYRLEAIEFLETGDAPQYLRNVSQILTGRADDQVEKRLAEESDRTAHYLSTLTHVQLQELLVAELLTPHLDAILHMAGSGLVTMVDHDRTSDLSRMYKLFLLVPLDLGKDALRFALRADVEDRGKAINDSANEPEPGPSTAGDGNQDMEADVKGKGKVKPVTNTSAALTSALRWVQDVLDLKDKFDKILDQAFGGDKAVQTSINLVSLTYA